MKDNVTILQGPTVLWRHAGIVFYTSLQAGEVRQIPIKLSLNCIGEFPLNKRKIFILGYQTQSKECLKDQLDAPGGSKTMGYFVEDGQVFNADLILPHAYSSITQCVFVISAEEVNSVSKSTVVVVTSKKQLMYLKGMPGFLLKNLTTFRWSTLDGMDVCLPSLSTMDMSVRYGKILFRYWNAIL